MFPDFEEKGKIFTQVISKEPVDVIIQTTTVQIRGQVHVKLDERLKDELDLTPRFLAVTHASIYPQDKKLTAWKTKFVAVNVDHIVWVTPQEELFTIENGEP